MKHRDGKSSLQVYIETEDLEKFRSIMKKMQGYTITDFLKSVIQDFNNQFECLLNVDALSIPKLLQQNLDNINLELQKGIIDVQNIVKAKQSGGGENGK